MAVVDSITGKVLAKPEIGEGPDAAGYDPKSKLAFSSNGEGTLSVIDTNTYKTIQTLKTEPRARTMALDTATGKIYLVTAKVSSAPAPTAEVPHPRPTVLPNSFAVLVVNQ